jgi:hypothetical protein
LKYFYYFYFGFTATLAYHYFSLTVLDSLICLYSSEVFERDGAERHQKERGAPQKPRQKVKGSGATHQTTEGGCMEAKEHGRRAPHPHTMRTGTIGTFEN